MKKRLYPHPLIAREGWLYLVVSLLLFFLAAWALPLWLSLLFLGVFLFILQFFRDPQRVVPQDAAAVLSPADGRVVVVQKDTNIYTQETCLKVSVFMNVFNVHANRVPCSGEIDQVVYIPGNFLNAALDKASVENERNVVVIRSREGHRVTCVQVAGLIARRILCYVKPGQKVEAGERYGFIRFGSRVDVYCPDSAIPQVAVGDKVKATETILVKLPS